MCPLYPLCILSIRGPSLLFNMIMQVGNERITAVRVAYSDAQMKPVDAAGVPTGDDAVVGQMAIENLVRHSFLKDELFLDVRAHCPHLPHVHPVGQKSFKFILIHVTDHTIPGGCIVHSDGGNRPWFNEASGVPRADFRSVQPLLHVTDHTIPGGCIVHSDGGNRPWFNEASGVPRADFRSVCDKQDGSGWFLSEPGEPCS